MKTVDATFAARLASDTTTLAKIVQFTLLNGTVIRLTDSDRDIVYLGNTYSAGNGCVVSQVQAQVGANTQSCTVEVLMSAQGVNSNVIETGALDDAEFIVGVVDFAMPTLAAIIQYHGFVSKATYKDRIYATIEGMPLSARGKPLAIDVFASNCRADLGDAKCKVNIDALKATGCTVTAVIDAQQFTCTYVNGNWSNGLVVFTSGDANGLSFEVSYAEPGKLTLKGLMVIEPAPGDTFTLYPGCDKTIGNCNAYGNLLNFRGENFSVAPYTATAAPAAVAPQTTPSPATVTQAPAPTTDSGGGHGADWAGNGTSTSGTVGRPF